MKRIICGIGILIGLLLGGCYVQSVYPYYTEKDLIFDQTLLGSWKSASKNSDSNETWVFEKDGDLAYKFTIQDDKTNLLSAHLFKLENHRFLDCVFQTNLDADAIPAHHLMAISQIDPLLKINILNSEEIKKFLAKNPDALRALPESIKTDDKHSGPVVLTANTRELQAFILKHLENTNLFTEFEVMKKVSDPAK